ncbi:MAG: hypothetical protein J7L26_12705 [Candidatus Aminicenantes bacterium]|nr:hypothetical protein [Candidatus Aminicenantes bacterium]
MMKDRLITWVSIGVFVGIIIGIIIGYSVSQKQIWFWGIEKKQKEIELTIRRIELEEKKLDAILRAIKTYDREICRLIEDLRMRPNEED